MIVHRSTGIAYPNTPHVELFRLDSPKLPGVIFLRDAGTGGNVLLYTAPAVDGGPGTWTLRSTVVLPGRALKMETLPTEDVFLKVVPASSPVEFDISSASPLYYSKHMP